MFRLGQSAHDRGCECSSSGNGTFAPRYTSSALTILSYRLYRNMSIERSAEQIQTRSTTSRGEEGSVNDVAQSRYGVRVVGISCMGLDIV